MLLMLLLAAAASGSPIGEAVGPLSFPPELSVGQPPPYLATVNNCRCKLCHTAPLQKDHALQAAAQTFADTCPTEASGEDTRNGAGETVFFHSSSSLDANAIWEAAVAEWFGEMTHYNDGDFGGARRFITLEAESQLAVGCAYSVCPDDHTVAVCRYRNAQGKWSDDVRHFQGKADLNDASCRAAGASDPACASDPALEVPAHSSNLHVNQSTAFL